MYIALSYGYKIKALYSLIMDRYFKGYFPILCSLKSTFHQVRYKIKITFKGWFHNWILGGGSRDRPDGFVVPVHAGTEFR